MYPKTLKRALDLCTCLLAAPFLLPLGILLAVLIRLDSHGSVFFIQPRAGKDGSIFPLVKFRTLVEDVDQVAHGERMQSFIRGEAETLGPGRATFKPFDADQVTRVGAVLRRTSLDELPQFFNVIAGDMSLVGPRPNVCKEVEAYEPWHCGRLAALPGITGLAQVRGRSAVSFDEIVRNDLEYIEKQSLWLDLKILWWTFATVLCGAGAE